MTVAELAVRLAQTEPRLGRTRLVAVDGRSGSGKTWLAAELATPLGAPVIHLDDLYPGWDGLTKAADVLAQWVIEPLSKGEPARWRRFDWDAMSYAEWHTTEAADVVVLEGGGSSVRAGRRLRGPDLGRSPGRSPAATAASAAGLDRLEPFARRWAELEDQLYRTEHTRRHCDVIVENPPPAIDGDRDVRLSVQLRGPG